MSADVLLSRLANVRKSGNGWISSCPSHGGHDCLTIHESDGKTLVHCFAGCDTRDVVEAVDLRLSDLFADSLNPERKREYQIQSARSARDHAKLIMDIAGAQAAESDFTGEDLEALQKAHETYKAATEQLATLEETQPEEPEENRFISRLTYDADAELDRLANQQWIVDQIIPADAFGVMYGASGTYKSFMAMSIAASIAANSPWFNADVDNPGQVIYIGAEGAAGLQARKKAWSIRHGLPTNQLGILADSPTINSATDCELLVQMCEIAADELNAPIRLIVVDTLARTFAGEENSATDMSAFVRSCDRIRRATGASILVVHHAGKDLDKGARGSSALRAACDFEFKVSALGKKHTKLSCTKAKDVEPFEDMEFKLDVVELGRNDAKGRPMVSLVPRLHSIGSSEDQPAQEATGKTQVLNDMITAAMARQGSEFITRAFLYDEWKFIHRGNKETSIRSSFSKALNELIDNGWIVMGKDELIYREAPF